MNDENTDGAGRSFFDGVVIAPPQTNPAKLEGIAKVRGYMMKGTEVRIEKLRAGKTDRWYRQTKDGWRGGVRFKGAEVFAFYARTKEELIELYETWVLVGLPAGKFDEYIQKHLGEKLENYE
jgi:hypothetical protein